MDSIDSTSKKAYVIMFSSALVEDPEPVAVFLDKDKAEKFWHESNEEESWDEEDILGYFIEEVELHE